MDFRSNIPLYLQVIADIKKKIITGQLTPGEKLPSTRELAALYQINPNTVVRVYNEMELQNLTFTKRGIGTFITEDAHRLSLLKEEMAKLLAGELIKELKDIGYTKEEFLDTVARIYDVTL